MLETFSGIAIKALATALPERVVTVESFIPQFGEETVTRFRQAVGVESFRRAAPEQTTADLACEAIAKLAAAGRFQPEEIDVLLFVTQTPDAVAPATSALLQKRLGLSEELFALDINQGCSGFLAGLLTAAHFLSNPSVRNVLLVGGDTLTRCVNPDDHGAAMLFGDAGFACVVGRDEAAAPWTFAVNTAASNAIRIPHGGTFEMAGTEVFNFTITKVPEQIQRLLAHTGKQMNDIDLLCLHQANAFIVRQVARMLRCPPEKVPLNLTHLGNTSSATLPLLLADLPYSDTKTLLLSAFGVGLSWISLLCTLDFKTILPLEESTTR